MSGSEAFGAWTDAAGQHDENEPPVQGGEMSGLLSGVQFYSQVQETLLSAEAKKILTGLLIRWSLGERGRASLVKVVQRLQGIVDLQGLQELEP